MRPIHVSVAVAGSTLALGALLCTEGGFWSGQRHPAAAGSDGSSVGEHPPGRAGWQRVEVPGSVRSIVGVNSGNPPPHLLAAGIDGDEPLLVDVTNGVATGFTGDLPNRYRNGLVTVATDGMTVAVSEQLAPAPGREASVWFGAEHTTYLEHVPRDAQGRTPGWLRPLLSNDGSYAVGAVWVRGRWWLHAWEVSDDWVPLDRGEQLYVRGEPTPQSVLAEWVEGELIVAGSLSDRSDAGDPAWQVWSINDRAADFGQGHWQRHRMASTPDGVTDLQGWAMGWWVAGHRRGRPVVYDFYKQGGRSISMPDTWLDHDHPAVYVAGMPIASPMVLATQSTDGPTVWVGNGQDWSRFPAPTGKLSGAQAVGDGVYLLIDDALWFRSLPQH